MSYQNYNGPPMPEARTSPSFISHLQRYGRSRLFLTGIILFTIGTTLSTIISWTLLAFIPLALAALPIIGFWLIYASSKNAEKPEKVLTALTLFKVHTIITLVLMCLLAMLITLLSLATYFGGAGTSADLAFSLFAALIMFSLIPLYYVSILNIIKSIRQNIINNTFNPIRGVLPFTIITFIYVGFFVLAIVVMLVLMGISGLLAINEPMWYYPTQDVFSGVAMMSMLMMFVVFVSVIYLSGMVGTVICVIILNRLAKSISNILLHND
ncbi:MAG: hypothetical protein FWC76_03430 [Defluviitaleaceae bacterium]|nr:hypothetical protein [Defluviitaleaceae bacterium]